MYYQSKAFVLFIVDIFSLLYPNYTLFSISGGVSNVFYFIPTGSNVIASQEKTKYILYLICYIIKDIIYT